MLEHVTFNVEIYAGGGCYFFRVRWIVWVDVAM